MVLAGTRSMVWSGCRGAICAAATFGHALPCAFGTAALETEQCVVRLSRQDLRDSDQPDGNLSGQFGVCRKVTRASEGLVHFLERGTRKDVIEVPPDMVASVLPTGYRSISHDV